MITSVTPTVMHMHAYLLHVHFLQLFRNFVHRSLDVRIFAVAVGGSRSTGSGSRCSRLLLTGGRVREAK